MAFFVQGSGLELGGVKNLQSVERASKLGVRAWSKHQTLPYINHTNHLDPPLGEPRAPEIGARPP